MRSLIYYLDRWIQTHLSYLIKNLASAAIIFALAANTVKTDAFETYTETNSCLFALLMCAIWSGIFNSIALFYSEADYTLDDLDKIVSVKVYVIANLFIQTCICAAQGIICTTIFNRIIGYDLDAICFGNVNLDFVMTFFLITLSADMLGFATGMLVSNITTVMTLLPGVLIIQFLFSGCLFELGDLVKPIAKITTAKWGFEALGALARMNDLMEQDMGPLAETKECFEPTVANLRGCWINMLILTIAFTIIAGILLYRRVNYGRED